MGEPAEPPDNVAVSFGVTEPRLTKLSVQGNRKLLIGKVLGVCEWKAEELPQSRLKLVQVLSSDCLAGESTGNIVACVHARFSAEGIARKLIGQKNERQRRRRVVDPSVVPPVNHLEMQIDEAVVKGPIEACVFREPMSF